MLPRETNQLLDVRNRLLPVESSGDRGQKVGFRQHGFQQGRRTDAIAFLLQPRDERSHPMDGVCIVALQHCRASRVADRVPAQTVPAVPREHDQRVVRYGTQRRPENGQQREVVFRIDRQRQKLQEVRHLACLIEAATFEDEVRNVLLQQGAAEHVEIGEPPE